MTNRYSVPPLAIGGFLERYEAAPDDLEGPELLILARTFERMGCDSQALDCAERASQKDPELRSEALEVARRCIGRDSKPT